MADLITVGITCYNAETTIERCINSALAQTWPNTEILIIDDSSEDNTENIAYKLKKKNHLVKYFKKNFKSLSKSTNFGVKKSKSKWITKIDADDYISKNFLKVFFIIFLRIFVVYKLFIKIYFFSSVIKVGSRFRGDFSVKQ